ncbi:hypothetical protein BCR33DRAFT_710971 [Rhizoclosmatium globosum]|uniref:Arrestin-like N-terminal domain-containing protein n=1 Tax=Rhizoclosmatium globosum TaxID=329046 RepID=A0A1Y2D2R2_9FUNG|nr:hypothetical protein BCR33DRAFT_710971 [Rhizoclosmatium globosum]|eukprot:ORY53572.1 hypothetical protein BCR33DRAFT_710971 [Rhizoclosmatium globosum]
MADIGVVNIKIDAQEDATPGTTVTGSVQFDTTIPDLKIVEVVLRVEALAYLITKEQDDEPESAVPRHRRFLNHIRKWGKHPTYDVVEVLFAADVPVLPEPVTVQPGHHEKTFEFTIPQDAPVTEVKQKNDDDAAIVLYRYYAAVKVPYLI